MAEVAVVAAGEIQWQYWQCFELRLMVWARRELSIPMGVAPLYVDSESFVKESLSSSMDNGSGDPVTTARPESSSRSG